MSKTSLPFLPNLVEEYSLNIADPGHWNDNNEFGKLVASLKVTTDDNTRICSIPDILARPKLFTDVLSNAQHPLYSKYRVQWRALMTIMALRKVRGAESQIKVGAIKVPKKASEDLPEFLKVLVKAPLKDYIDMQNDTTFNASEYQTVLYVVTFDEKPFAIAWPNVFLCPAANVEKNRPEVDNKFQWWKKEGFDDPIPYLTPEEKNLVYGWLKNVMDNVPGDKKYTKLVDLLSEYSKDLEASLGNNFEKVKTSVDDSRNVMTGFVKFVDAPINYEISKETLNISDIQLQNLQNSDKPRLLILSRNIGEEWGDPNTISLAGPIKVGTIINECNIFGRPKSNYVVGDVDLRNYGAELRMAEDFFTDKLGVVLIKQAFVNTYNSTIYKYNDEDVSLIFPLKREILYYLTPYYLANNLKFKIIDENEIQVSLELPIEGKDEKRITARKTYKYELDDTDTNVGEIIEMDQVPLVQVWPNFVIKNWKAYYTYYDACGKDRIFRAEPTWDQDPYLKRDFSATREPKTQICKSDTFPEGFICYYKDYTDQTKEEEDLGLILLIKPQEHTNKTVLNDCRIGIDFGTTNTVAFMKNGDEKGSLIKIKNRMLDVCCVKDGNLQAFEKRQLRMNFLSAVDQPNGETNVSIRTMFHTHTDRAEENTETILFKGNIYYLDNYDNINNDRYILKTIHHSDLKWSGAKAQENTRGFLKQLCLQCMAEAVYNGAVNIEWRFSYPGAFTEQQKDEYKGLWRNRIWSELQSAFEYNVEMPKTFPESACVLAYFQDNMNASTNHGMICVDIGGGSTDIAIRQGVGSKENLQHQVSVKFAGRDILTNYLWTKHTNTGQALSVVKSLDDEKYNEQIEEINRVKDEKEFGLQLEAFLKYYEKSLIMGLSEASSEEKGARLVTDITFALSGIFFYIGFIVGKLRQLGIYNKTEDLPYIYVGGNASKLIDWASKGNFFADSVTEKVFKNMFLAGLYYVEGEIPENRFFKIRKTEAPKQEVAAGLLSDKVKEDKTKKDDGGIFADIEGIDFARGLSDKAEVDNILIESLASDSGIVFAGENFVYNDGTPGKDDNTLSARDFTKGVKIPNNKPVVFKYFLNMFNQIASKSGYLSVEFTEDNLYEICRSVNDELSEEVDRDEKDISMKSLFITMLKEAILFNAKR